jgi:hypothetical protein
MATAARWIVLVRAAATLGATASGAVLVWSLARRPLVVLLARLHDDGPAGIAGLRFEQLLTGLCSAALVAAFGWLLLVVTSVLVEAVLAAEPGRTRGGPCPPALRRLVLAGCGLAVTGGLSVAPATADAGGVGGLPLPDRTVGTAAGPPAMAGVVTVAAGDSLWSIAKRALPSGAGDAAITRAWHATYRRNADRIGPDPDLILPGTSLRLPRLDRHQRRDNP